MRLFGAAIFAQLALRNNRRANGPALCSGAQMLSVPTLIWENAIVRNKIIGAVALVAAFGALAVPAEAQAPAWPTRTVRFIVPFGPGAGADIGARLFAEKLAARWVNPS